jgi:hypothetical protein
VAGSSIPLLFLTKKTKMQTINIQINADRSESAKECLKEIARRIKFGCTSGQETAWNKSLEDAIAPATLIGNFPVSKLIQYVDLYKECISENGLDNDINRLSLQGLIEFVEKYLIPNQE